MAKVKREFPSIYRIITENLKQSLRPASLKRFSKKNPKLLKKLKFQGSVTFFIVTTALILLLSFDLLVSLQRQKELDFEKTKIRSEIKLWEEIAKKYQGYKEAYYELAVLNYKIGEVDKANFYVQKALYFDPNFEKARNLQKLIRGY